MIWFICMIVLICIMGSVLTYDALEWWLNQTGDDYVNSDSHGHGRNEK